MAMGKMTEKGVTTTTAPGQEQYEQHEHFRGRTAKIFIAYDYRHTDGELFSCVKSTLEDCRIARDVWLSKKRGGMK